MYKRQVTAVMSAEEEWLEGDIFIESTGSTGPMGNCLRYGNGCSMCILRCPSYGPRISLSKRAGIEDILGQRADDSYGAMSGSCKLSKGSLSQKVQDLLDREGVVLSLIHIFLVYSSASPPYLTNQLATVNLLTR